MARNPSQLYVTKKGAVVEGKLFEDTQCVCKLKCNKKVTAEKRKSLFESFWKIGNFVRQPIFVE